MSDEILKVERDGAIATVTLNRPDSLNALNEALMEAIERVSQNFLDDEETRVVVFRGAGRHFSAGADLKAPRATSERSLLMRRRQAGLGARMIRAMLDINQVTICALHGVALGGAACIATACDFRIGTDDCRVGYPEVNLGINLMWRSLPLCVRLIGPARAKRMIMLGQHEEARTLAEWGFLDEIVAPDQLDATVSDMARAYAKQPPIAVQMIKQSINAVSNAMDDAIMHMDTDQNILTTQTRDRAEGIGAFFDKREPDFKGN
ncbi:MAG: enoyl-CoA hydratase/isomerase family protein [Gammaproteobacteria bacterium]|nr:enoyl-CoA hydratase/isomerase family protein [Gammaproteobacteria bacterium]